MCKSKLFQYEHNLQHFIFLYHIKINMITNFSIQQLQQKQIQNANIVHFKSNTASVCKISSIRNRLRRAIFNQPQKKYREQNEQKLFIQNSLNTKSIDEKKLQFSRRESLNVIKQNPIRKTIEGFHKNFNRTKVDWQHNFTGSKYIQKIKQEVQQTKFYRIFPKKITEVNVPMKNQNYIRKDNSQQNLVEPNYISHSYKRRLSEEQLRKINKIKQQRRIKLNNCQSFKQIKRPEENRNILESKEKIKRDLLEEDKFLPITPWDDQNSMNLSNVWLK